MSLWGPPYIQVKMLYLWHLITQNAFMYKLIQDLTIPTPFTNPSLGGSGTKEKKGEEANTVTVFTKENTMNNEYIPPKVGGALYCRVTLRLKSNL